jgi:hypothetical protein
MVKDNWGVSVKIVYLFGVYFVQGKGWFITSAGLTANDALIT